MGCAVALSVGRGLAPAGLWGKVAFILEGELHPSGLRLPPSSAEEGYRKVTFVGSRGVCDGRMFARVVGVAKRHERNE